MRNTLNKNTNNTNNYNNKNNKNKINNKWDSEWPTGLEVFSINNSELLFFYGWFVDGVQK